MKVVQLQNHRPAKLFYALLILFILLILGYFGRGWIRTSVSPGTASLLYKSQVQSAFNQARDEINASQTLGLTASRTLPANCWLDTASGIEIKVTCGASTTESGHLADAAAQELFNRKVVALHERLHDDGWEGGLAIDRLGTPTVANLSKPADWLQYGKKMNGTFCLFQFGTLPDTPAGSHIDGNLSCTRRVGF